MKTGNHQAVEVRYDGSDHGQVECVKNVLLLVQESEAKEIRHDKRLDMYVSGVIIQWNCSLRKLTLEINPRAR